MLYELVIKKLGSQVRSFIGIDPGAVVKLECAELIVDGTSTGSHSFYYGRRMRYTGAEDAYQRRLARYSGIEEALKENTFYLIDGRNLNIK